MDRAIRVLLVDDSDAFRQAAGRYLRHQALCNLVGTASSGDEALECVMLLQPDLVLLDIAMPGANGLEVARRMKSRLPAPRVVMVTIHDDATYRNAAREAGADGFITKSEFTVQILSLLRELAEPPREPLGGRE
jgi:DNA-binding NarL/FixJ family response regulator